jgi:hypothetical protein
MFLFKAFIVVLLLWAFSVMFLFKAFIVVLLLWALLVMLLFWGYSPCSYSRHSASCSCSRASCCAFYFGVTATCTKWNSCSTFQGKLVFFFFNLINIFCFFLVLCAFIFCGCVVVLQDLSLPTN